MGPSESSAVKAAWARYHEGIADLREALYAHELARNPADAAKLQYWLLQAQAAVFNMVIAPRYEQPRFYINTIFEPNVYTWMLPNADFIYRYCFLDGSRSFRIVGKRGAPRFLDAQMMRGFWGDADMKLTGNYDFRTWKIDSGDNFEIIVGPEKPKGGEFWIPTDASSPKHCLLVREAIYDWTNDATSTMRIEPIDSKLEQLAPLTEAEVIARMDAALRMMRFCWEQFGGPFSSTILNKAGINHFYHFPTSTNQDGSHPAAGYIPAIYELEEDEALIIEIELGNALYWNVVLSDVWLQAADYVYRQSTLNGAQAITDADGKVRLVLSVKDPGVQNWLDPVGNLRGMVLLRWYYTDRFTVPTIKRVKFSDVQSALLPGTTSVSAANRAEQLQQRASAALGRFGY